MDFLRRNSVKFAFIAIIVFFALPFIYGNEEEDGFSPFAVRSGMSYQANPISRLANRIASFYGLPFRSHQEGAISKTDVIKGKIAKHPMFAKENGDKANSINATLMASAKHADDNDKISQNTNPSAFSANSYQAAAARNTNTPYKGTVNINGKDYKVIEDIKGEKYVVTPKGHIPYKDVLRKTVSEKEFLSAKKLMPNASDIEVLEKIRAEKAQQFANNPLANSQNYQTAYKTGTANAMGGNGAMRVSYNDKGLDNNALSNAYDDLKKMNVNVEIPAGSSSTSYRGGYSYGSNNADTKDKQSAEDLTPSGIARQARSNFQEEITAKEQEKQTKTQNPVGNQPAKIRSYNIENQEIDNISSADRKVMVLTENSNRGYDVWLGGKNYKKTENGYEITFSSNEEDDEEFIIKNKERINFAIKQIYSLWGSLDPNVKKNIVIKTDGKMDDLSRDALSKINIEDSKNIDPARAIYIDGPIYTPESFEEFLQQLKELVGNDENKENANA